MPCWIPRNMLEITTVFQSGASMTRMGTPKPMTHPIIIGMRRPYKSANIPTARFPIAFEIPKATKNIMDWNLLSTINKSPNSSTLPVVTVMNP